MNIHTSSEILLIVGRIVVCIPHELLPGTKQAVRKLVVDVSNIAVDCIRETYRFSEVSGCLNIRLDWGLRTRAAPMFR